MNQQVRLWPTPEAYLAAMRPDHPVLFFSAAALRAVHDAFRAGFPGLVTYAVKANPDARVLRVLADAGMGAFDVASVAEIEAVRAVCPGAVLHYNNPVRSRDEIAAALRAGVRSFAVDRSGELEKLAALAPGDCEVSVRFKLPVAGAAYDFGAKFGADPAEAAALMRRAGAAEFTVSLAFHPGTQCSGPAPWGDYIAAAARLERQSGVRVRRLNVGGGFPGHRAGERPNLQRFFATIGAAVDRAWPRAGRPALLCEPGRGMVGEAMVLALRVKARDGFRLYLNDGVYGTLAEFPDIGAVQRVSVPGAGGAARPFEVFGPTCDSLDRLPEPLMLPGGVAEGDHVLFFGMGAYSSALSTRFNGYGGAEVVDLSRGLAAAGAVGETGAREIPPQA